MVRVSKESKEGSMTSKKHVVHAPCIPMCELPPFVLVFFWHSAEKNEKMNIFNISVFQWVKVGPCYSEVETSCGC